MKEMRIIEVIALTVFIGIIILAPRGSTNTVARLGMEATGRPAYSVEQNLSVVRELQEKGSLYDLGRQELRTKDFLFWSESSFGLMLDLTLAEEKGLPVVISLVYPGSVTETNATRTEEGKAYWHLVGGKKEELKLHAREIRWYLIVPFLISAAYLGWLFIQKKRS